MNKTSNMNSNFYDIVSNPDEDWKEQSPSKWSLVARRGMPEASPLKINPPHHWLKNEATSIHAPVEVVSDPTIINLRAMTRPRRTTVEVVKSYDENCDDNDKVDARSGGHGIKRNDEAFIVQSEKPKANQHKKRRPKATKPKAGSKRAKVFTDRTKVDHPLSSLARLSSKKPNAKASSKLNAKV